MKSLTGHSPGGVDFLPLSWYLWKARVQLLQSPGGQALQGGCQLRAVCLLQVALQGRYDGLKERKSKAGVGPIIVWWTAATLTIPQEIHILKTDEVSLKFS